MVMYGYLIIQANCGRIWRHMVAYDYIWIHTTFLCIAVLVGNGAVSAAHIVREGTVNSHISSHTGSPGRVSSHADGTGGHKTINYHTTLYTGLLQVII